MIVKKKERKKEKNKQNATGIEYKEKEGKYDCKKERKKERK